MKLRQFDFVDEKPAEVSVTVSSDVTSRSALAELLSSRLGFPSHYTGRSWDATYDCLTDFEWLDEGATVVIWHPSLPLLGPRDVRIYLEVLADAAESWASDPALTFRAVFDAALRSKVSNLLD